jgi:amidase
MFNVTVPNRPARYAFVASAEPIARVGPGATVRFETSDDSYANLSGAEIDGGRVNFRKVNALSGPIWVEGAEPGDALGFRVDRIEVATRAFVVYVSRWRRRMFGLAESNVIEVTVGGDRVGLPNGRSIRVGPMIGCIGVAPASGSVSSLSPGSRTGGNMDLVEIKPGATVWLPVEVEGGLLSLGDLHARMGRGEPVGAGLECAGSVTGTVLLAPAMALAGPIFCDEWRVSFVGTSPDEWREAETVAVNAAWEWLTVSCGVLHDDALVICAALLDVDAGGPAGNNVVASFPLAELRDAGVQVDVWPVR